MKRLLARVLRHKESLSPLETLVEPLQTPEEINAEMKAKYGSTFWGKDIGSPNISQETIHWLVEYVFENKGHCIWGGHGSESYVRSGGSTPTVIWDAIPEYKHSKWEQADKVARIARQAYRESIHRLYDEYRRRKEIRELLGELDK